MTDPCETCPEHAGHKTSLSNLWAIVVIMLAGFGGLAVWSVAGDAESRAYTDAKIRPLLEDVRRSAADSKITREAAITMEINLRSYLESQGYTYQEHQ